MASDGLVHRVFTYGTLKTGQPNHHIINDKDLGEARLVGQAKTKEKFPLVIANRYNTPYLLDAQGTGKRITGEVYAVDDKMKENLDKLEGHPHYYTGTMLSVEYLADQEAEGLAWTYVFKNFRPHLIESQQYDEYDSYGSHNTPYISPAERTEKENPFETWKQVKLDLCVDGTPLDVPTQILE